MLFNSIHFLIFFVFVFCVYWPLPRIFQNYWLLIVSLVFYGYWDWRFLSLLIISTVVDYIVSLRIHLLHEKSKPKSARNLLWISIFVNLGFLFSFKYFGVFQDELRMHDSGTRFSATDFVIPLGISFYTFQALGYVIDVYRRSIQPSRNYFEFLLFVSFFPQLIAGPIEKASHLVPQFYTDRNLDLHQVMDSVFIFIWGLFLKTVLADNLSPFVLGYFEDPHKTGTLQALMSSYAAGLHVYGDFAGYTYMALGIGGLLGFKLTDNFRQPYLSKGPQEFWSRWHITLVNWFRSYIFVPLSRVLAQRTSIPVAASLSLTFTMLLFAVWHGPSVTFFVWGILQVVVYLIYHQIHKFVKKKNIRPWYPWLQIIIWFNVLCLTSGVYRSKDLSGFYLHLQNLFRGFQIGELELQLFLSLFTFAVPWLIVEIIHRRSSEETFFKKHHWKIRTAFAVFLYLIVIFCGVPGSWSFIYFYF